MKLYYSKPETLSAAIFGERRGIVNRGILFRGKRADTNEWIYGDVQQNVDAVKIREQEPNIQHVARSFVVIPETVGQYTGMKDKNGRKLFEGDIIEYIFPVTNKAVEKETGVVIYDDCGFHIANDGCMLCVASGDGDVVIEVIGNIHDNPDLLEVSDNG